MKYKITIEKIERKMVKQENWVQVDPYKDDEGKTKNFDYRNEEKEEDVSENIYEQTIENDKFVIKSVIDAFNNSDSI